ncbi:MULTISPECIES: RNA polymerase sigma factor SigF [Streptomyces]|uniref:RNA polymerase sigma factor SigF n=2 Tax=Streptomyces rochei group TaxID=2867164 RepID=A0ABY6C2P0_9ACTN|nr:MULTISPECIES: RNA polymerase sigma factor SigF [Streptomyces]RIH62410.1 RNA polymerase sigma factor SigF [Streptomyces sp. SHP22-7]MBJ6621401.1 RNA polymerase sigma factor SigF [Streptomyces sp. DHE17-7]MBQ0879407.1 RNA polymerase sigma factor SigF [Streptomyces sp. RT42]MBQ0912428.1 RNA polymerase sigma factor SigF [Streptomyces sp. RM99]MBU8551864.1 RNA polymerase sigma factor SigF [Streptomyces sp. Osf17]
MRNGDGPVRDDERGTRERPAEGTRADNEARRMADGIDGIPEQARPHPEDEAPPGAVVPGDGQRTGDDTPVRPVRAEAKARERATGGTMSEHERHSEDEVPGARATQSTRHDPQDRSGARLLFAELRTLEKDSPEYAELRNRLVRMHLPLVEHLARRFRNRGEPLDDLTQVATIGLIKSVDRFDPDRGVEFSTYATPTVVGEIKRHFRDKGWAVRVPRRLQELRLALTTATAELSQLHGRSPTVHELAEKLAISEEEVLEGLESANAYSTLSLDVPDTDDESPAVADTLGAEDEALEGVEYRESLKPLLEDLPPREKRILLLRFFGNMTQSQIAQEVGISQMHVSRLLARTLAQLREKLLVEE